LSASGSAFPGAPSMLAHDDPADVLKRQAAERLRAPVRKIGALS
jgi:hypothetical protein